MKILSKYKDYYDYLQGIYGIDETLVYDRRTINLVKYDKDLFGDYCHTYEFHVCNIKYTLHHYKNKFYYTIDELKTLNKILYNDGKDTLTFMSKHRYSSSDVNIINYWNRNNGSTMINKKFRQPVLVVYTSGEIVDETEGKHPTHYGIPLLKSFQFQKLLSAEECFINISAFLGWLKDNPEIPNKQTNKEKIISHGFDLINSFRNVK